MRMEEILEHMKNTPKDDNGNIIRGEDMFDFSGQLKGDNGVSGVILNIESLEQRRSELLDEVYDINAQIQQLQIGDYNFEGKFVHWKEHGYMFVSWQNIIKYDGKPRMFFQGFWFDCLYGAYTDSNYAYYNALHEWYIPMDTFKYVINNEKFYEISKETFENAWVELCNDIYENGLKFMKIKT